MSQSDKRLTPELLKLSPISGSEEMFKLPPNTERKADGIYRYRRRVPVKALNALGKGFLYRNLGRTKEEVLGNWAKAREEVEALFEQAKSNTNWFFLMY